MTLAELDTPFERRRAIEYGKDGNKVVRHWYEVQQVIGPIYKSKDSKDERGVTEFKLFIFFTEKTDGLQFQWLSHPEFYTVEKVADMMRSYQLDSVTHMYANLNERMEGNKFIGNAEIEFFRQFDQAAADRYAQYRKDYYAKQEEKDRQARLARQAEEDAEKARKQAELAKAKEAYLGWADQMSALRFGQVSVHMEKKSRFDGKVMSHREFIIQSVKDGWMPQRKDGVTTWYGSRWEKKESKPKTVYMLSKDNYCYTISKTEYDFAEYLVDKLGLK